MTPRSANVFGQELSRSLTDADKRYMIDQYVSGRTFTSIAHEFGFRCGTPVRKIVAQGTSIRGCEALSFDTPVGQQMVKDYLAGQRPSKIAKRYGYSMYSLRRCFAQAGVPLLIQNPDESLSLDYIALKYKQGLGICELQKQYGPRIKDLLIAHGVPIRTLKEAGAVAGIQRSIKHASRETFPKFSYHVRRLTSAVYSLYHDIINPQQLSIGRYDHHIDHIYSVNQAKHNPSGLIHPVNIWEVCHPANLRVVSWEKNLRKQAHIGCTARQLRQRIQDWNLKFLDPYYVTSNSVFKQIAHIYGYYDHFGELGHSSSRRYYKTSNSPQCSICI